MLIGRGYSVQHISKEQGTSNLHRMALLFLLDKIVRPMVIDHSLLLVDLLNRKARPVGIGFRLSTRTSIRLQPKSLFLPLDNNNSPQLQRLRIDSCRYIRLVRISC